MERLTNKSVLERMNKFPKDYTFSTEELIYKKLGKLEDNEEELDTNLTTLCEVLKHNECYDEENKDCHIVGVTKDEVILMPKAFPYGECEFTRPFTELNTTWYLNKR